MWTGTSLTAHPGALRLIHWEILKKYLIIGIENYRMGGARQGESLNEKHARLLDFKTGFGCGIDQGFHFTFVIKSIKYRLYLFLLKLKSKLNK